MSATCVDNVTESGREVKGFVCQSTVVPSGLRSQNVVSTQPFVIGDALLGRRHHLSPCHVFFVVFNGKNRLSKAFHQFSLKLIRLSSKGVSTHTSLSGISSPNWLFPSSSSLPDVIFYFR